MNRRQLITLAGGLIVGEPARRAYSFLNGAGFPRGFEGRLLHAYSSPPLSPSEIEAKITELMRKWPGPIHGTLSACFVGTSVVESDRDE